MRQIRLEKWVSTKDASGDFKETITKYNLWAEIVTSSSSRESSAGSSRLSNSVQFKVRFRPDMKPGTNWKVVFDGKRYTVTGIEKENGNRFYWIISANGV